MTGAEAIEHGRHALERQLPVIGTRRQAWHPRVQDQREGQRLVVEYAPHERAAAVRCVIAKFYSDQTGVNSFEAMTSVSAGIDSMVGTAPALAVPRALFYDGDLRLLVQERVVGAPYLELLERRNFRSHLRLAGRALACLHSLPCHLAAKDIEEHMAELMRPHPLRLAEALPHERARIESLVCALVAAARARQRGCARLHRDFHMRQLFRRGKRIWVIDWDLSASGDPALDAGNFLVNICKHAPERAQHGSAAFLEGYLSDGPAEVEARLPLYEAFNHLRLACKAFRLREPGWDEPMRGRLLASERSLEAL